MKFSLKKENDTATRTYKYNDNEKKLLVDLEYLSAIPKIIPITIEYKQITVIPKSRYGKKEVVAVFIFPIWRLSLYSTKYLKISSPNIILLKNSLLVILKKSPLQKDDESGFP